MITNIEEGSKLTNTFRGGDFKRPNKFTRFRPHFFLLGLKEKDCWLGSGCSFNLCRSGFWRNLLGCDARPGYIHQGCSSVG